MSALRLRSASFSCWSCRSSCSNCWVIGDNTDFWKTDDEIAPCRARAAGSVDRAGDRAVSDPVGAADLVQAIRHHSGVAAGLGFRADAAELPGRPDRQHLYVAGVRRIDHPQPDRHARLDPARPGRGRASRLLAGAAAFPGKAAHRQLDSFDDHVSRRWSRSFRSSSSLRGSGSPILGRCWSFPTPLSGCR